MLVLLDSTLLEVLGDTSAGQAGQFGESSDPLSLIEEFAICPCSRFTTVGSAARPLTQADAVAASAGSNIVAFIQAGRAAKENRPARTEHASPNTDREKGEQTAASDSHLSHAVLSCKPVSAERTDSKLDPGNQELNRESALLPAGRAHPGNSTPDWKAVLIA